MTLQALEKPVGATHGGYRRLVRQVKADGADEAAGVVVPTAVFRPAILAVDLVERHNGTHRMSPLTIGVDAGQAYALSADAKTDQRCASASISVSKDRLLLATFTIQALPAVSMKPTA